MPLNKSISLADGTTIDELDMQQNNINNVRNVNANRIKDGALYYGLNGNAFSVPFDNTSTDFQQMNVSSQGSGSGGGELSTGTNADSYFLVEHTSDNSQYRFSESVTHSSTVRTNNLGSSSSIDYFLQGATRKGGWIDSSGNHVNNFGENGHVMCGWVANDFVIQLSDDRGNSFRKVGIQNDNAGDGELYTVTIHFDSEKKEYQAFRSKGSSKTPIHSEPDVVVTENETNLFPSNSLIEASSRPKMVVGTENGNNVRVEPGIMESIMSK